MRWPLLLVMALTVAGGCGDDGGDEPPGPIPIAREVAENRDVHVEVIREGEGPREAAEGDRIRVSYVLRRARDGRILQASQRRGRPFVATLRTPDVIEGWVQGIRGMREGEVRRIQVPPKLGYGETGDPEAGIGPDDVLVFDVELVGFLPPR